MEADIRKYVELRNQVHAGLSALRVQGRQIWGATRHPVQEIVLRLTVGVGDLARLARDHGEWLVADETQPSIVAARAELKKELGNVIFSTIRWIDDLGFDVLECLDLAINAQEKFAKSGRPR